MTSTEKYRARRALIENTRPLFAAVNLLIDSAAEPIHQAHLLLLSAKTRGSELAAMFHPRVDACAELLDELGSAVLAIAQPDVTVDSVRYPLRGRRTDFEGIADAGLEICEDGPLPCRQVKPSEMDGFEGFMSAIIDTMNDSASGGDLPDAAHCTDDESVAIISPRDGAEEAFRRWADEWLECKAWIAKEDEVPECDAAGEVGQA